MSTQKRVLLLGAGGNAGINFTKSLKMSKDPIWVLGCDLDPFYLASCNSDEKVLLPKGMTREEKLNRILGLVQKYRIDYIHAQPDPEVKFLLENGSELSKYIFPHSLEKWNQFANKLECQKEWSAKLDVQFRSHSLKTLIGTPSLFDELCSKNGKAWIRAIRGAGSRAALPVNTLRQAVEWANYWVSMRGMSLDDFMIAEFLDGREYAVQTLWSNGKLVHSQARERVVYFFGSIMPSGQSSTPAVARTVTESDIYDVAYRAISSIDPNANGVYCVDIKRDHDGKPMPMEINYGRFFTTSDFFAKIGMNSPEAIVRLHMGEKVEPVIEKAKADLYWIRGLDKEPYLLSGDDLKRLSLS